jgi:uncharacterized NAD-dependent epimerase/dehydratase family protein
MISDGSKLAVFMLGALDDQIGKMGAGLLRYSPHEIVCVIEPGHAGGSIPAAIGIDHPAKIVATVDEAAALGADVFVLGIAPPGGQIPDDWYPWIDKAIAKGMSIVNGLHDHLGPKYPDLQNGQWIWDIRQEPEGKPAVTLRASKMPAKRVLLVGTDMSVGKMTVGLELHKEARAQGIKASFVATGQIGITIMGRGVPLDAVRLDFAAGFIEDAVVECADSDLIFVEGQGSLCHPDSNSPLPLFRGAQATHLIMCHRAGMDRLMRMQAVEVPPLRDLMKLCEDLAAGGGTFIRPVTAAVALNTAHLNAEEAAKAIADLEQEVGIPVDDPVRNGAEKLLNTVR